MPVFEQEKILFRHLTALLKCMTLPFELIIINDASTDDSDAEIQRFIKYSEEYESSCQSLKYFKTLWPWYETRCDDFAIRESKGKYIIEVQADMLLREKGFDQIFYEMMDCDQSIIALSGRGTHSFESLKPTKDEEKNNAIKKIIKSRKVQKILFKLRKERRRLFKNQSKSPTTCVTEIKKTVEEFSITLETIFPSDLSFSKSGSAGFTNSLIDLLPYESVGEINSVISEQKGNIWFGDTVMRGPIVLNKDFYLQINGFNTKAFYLGDDDHDLFLRAKKINKRVGFTPINFASPLNLGNTRKKKTFASKIWRKFHSRIRARARRNSELEKFLSSEE